jgi:hypothetical protein
MDKDDLLLVKYCFSELKTPLPDCKVDYYTTIIKSLENDGIIRNIQEYKVELPFGNDEVEDTVLYTVENCEKYLYTFSCNELRENHTIPFNFSIGFSYETYNAAEILYVDITSNNYTFSTESDSNCLEVLKHKLRSKIKGGNNRYCLVDKQSAFYASRLYPHIHEIENFLRYYVNDVFVKIFGANWWNEAIASGIKNNRKNRIDDTREYAGEYKDIQPYLLSLELNDLMEIAKTRRIKWIPVYDSKIENILNHYSDADIISLLNNQCQTQIDIWEMCFKKHFSVEFSKNYATFEKRRNQVAHNKLLDFGAYKSILTICNKIIEELKLAHQKFCIEFISEEEQNMIEEYKADLAQQDQDEREALNSIAESESGVKVYSKKDIVELFNDVMFGLYNELEQIFEDRADIEFSKFIDLHSEETEQVIFTLKHRISDRCIEVTANLDINDSQGDTSILTVSSSMQGFIDSNDIQFTNGEYVYNSEQTSYMPETQEELNDNAVMEAKQNICEFIEEHFPNLKDEADMKKHLEAMGKTAGITENDVYCSECGEEYICIDDEYAPVGTCLNCGAKNHIIYCTYCQCPIEAIEKDDAGEDQHYCSFCEEKLFGED